MSTAAPHFDQDGFRLRGTAMSRVDGFSDVVFGFALTLLVVSLEVPHTYDELHKVLLGVFPFAICFLLFFTIWHAHFRFFRRYGLHDPATIWINCVLLFTVLVYVYPLKFLFTLVAWAPDPGRDSPVFSDPTQVRELVMVYGAGFAAIYLLLAALYTNAWRQRRELDLNPLEITLTLISILDNIGVGASGILCCLLAAILAPQHAGRACYAFLLIILWSRVHAILAKRRIHAARLRSQVAAEDIEAL